MPNPFRVRTSLSILLCSALLGFVAPCNAQPKPAPAKDQGVRVVTFAEKPLVIESVGLTVPLPEGSTTEQTSIGNRTSVKISSPTWQVSIQVPSLKNEEVTARELLEDLVLNLLEQSGVVYDASSVSGADLLDPDGTRRPADAPAPVKPRLAGYRAAIIEPLTTVSTAGGIEAERIYIKLPTEGSKKTASVVRGYVAFKTSPTQLVSFEFVTTEAQFASAKRIFETMLAAATVEDASLANAERQAAVEAGVKLIEGLDQATMERLLAKANNQWRRIFIPSETGHTSDDTEVGYQRITTRIGEGPVAGPGNSRGYVVQIDARIIMTENRICDSQAVYFLSFDRKREHWTMTNTFRDLNPVKDKRVPPLSYRNLGARDGNSLSVVLEGKGKGIDETVRCSIEGPGYISQVEALLLPTILQNAGISANFGFYSYMPRPQQIKYRNEDARQPPETPGIWTIVSNFGVAQGLQTSTVNDKGEVIRVELPDGQISEPTTLAVLKRLWQDKGLPLD